MTSSSPADAILDLPLETALALLNAARAEARTRQLNPLAICILDARGAVKCAIAEDGTSLKRGEIAKAKAEGALALGVGSRTLLSRARDLPLFMNAATLALGGGLIPAPGGVLIRANDGRLLGVVGVSGDSSDNDEACAVAGITAVGLKADPGEE